MSESQEPSTASSFGFTSTAHHVLGIPELLQIIFSFGTRASNVSNILVCQGWREIALDHVWREVDDIYYLVQLLAPLHYNRQSVFYVREPFEVVGQSLLKHRSPFRSFPAFQPPKIGRVSSLTLDVCVLSSTGPSCPPKIHSASKIVSLMTWLRRTCTTSEILPNLRTLWWNSFTTAGRATVFMHDKVTQFSFDKVSERLPRLSTDIFERMPSLRSLSWTNFYECHYRWDDEELVQLLSGLQKLQEVTLSRYVFSTKILKALSLLPELEVIQFRTKSGVRHPASPFDCTLQEGAFPMLYDLCLNSTLDDIRVYLTGGALLPRLRNLSVESARRDRVLPLTVQQFLMDVTRCYPTLEMVSMDLIITIEDGDSFRVGPSRLSPEHLHPILSLKQLTRLELRHYQPLQISEVDLVEFGTALPALENLVLNPEPLQLTRPEITLHSLLIVGQHFPNLFYLGIYLDAQDTTISMPNLPAKTRLFPDLRTLHVGMSPIASEVPEPVALFLSHLLSESEEVEIRSGISSRRSASRPSAIIEHCNKWDGVAKILPLLLQARKEEKARRRDVEKEVEDLRIRMRNEVIMG